MSLFRIFLIILGTTVIQAIGWIWNLYPLTYLDLPLVVTVYFSIMGRRVHSALLGSLLGLMQDAVQGLPLGVHGFAMTLTGYVMAGLSKKLVVERQGTQWLVLLLASLGNSLVVFLILFLIGRRFFPTYLAQTAVQALVTSVLGVFVLRFLYRQASPLTKRLKSTAGRFGGD